MSALSSPTTTNTTRAAWFMTGYVNVMRLGGGFGLSSMYATQRSSSVSSSWPGKRDAVWPSGPTPRRIRSKIGNRAELRWANSRISSFSYASESSSRSSASAGSMVWMCSAGMGIFEKSCSVSRAWFESGLSSGTTRSSA